MKPMVANVSKGSIVEPHASRDSHNACELRQQVTGQATWAVWGSRIEAVVGPHAPDWFNLETHHGARRVKTGYRRSVWRVKTPHGTFFCKVFERDRGQSWLARMLVPHAAVREWHLSLAAQLRGVPVVEAIALGIGRSSERGARHHRATRGRVVFITEAYEPSTSLGAACRQDAPRRQIIEATARLFAAAQRRGFAHLDGHPGNVLVREQNGRWEARFLDVHPARFFARPVPERIAIRTLGLLDHYFEVSAAASSPSSPLDRENAARPTQQKVGSLAFTKADRLRFLRRYLAQSPGFENQDARSRRLDLKRWTRAIRHQARKQAVRLAWQRDRRLHRTGRYFARIDLGAGWLGTVVLTLGRRHVFPEIDIPDFDLEQWQHALPTCLSAINKLTQSADGQSAGRVLWSHAAECQVGGIKAVMFLQHPVRNPVRAALIGSDARRIFEHAHRLRHREIPGPPVLGYLEHSSLGMINSCALILPGPTSH